jgi:hypothetical protein
MGVSPWTSCGGGAAVALGEQVVVYVTAEEALSLLERRLSARVQHTANPDAIVQEAMRRLMPDLVKDVGSLASLCDLSERQPRRRCLAAVGMPPKTVQRTLRLQRFVALAHARGGRGADLAQLTSDSGYADQRARRGASVAEVLYRHCAADARLVQAGHQTSLRKLPIHTCPPASVVKTSASEPVVTYLAMCSAKISTTGSGITTARA